MNIARVRNLTKDYSNRVVVDDVSFDVSSGEVVVLVGPNGSGKTTTMEMLVGLRRPRSGSAEIVGIPVRPGGSHREHIGVQLQQSGLPARIRVREALQSASTLYRNPVDLQRLLEMVGLTGAWKKYVDSLSGGQQRRLDVALACVGRPRLLVLDEPTSGLDPHGRAELWEMLRSLAGSSCAVVASTHDLSEAEAFADRVIMIQAGRIAFDGSVADALAQAGGDWRLRIASADADVDELCKSIELAHVRSGATVMAIGPRTAIEAARARIADRLDVSDRDIIAGPIRLEDVFLLVSGTEPNS
ncbi:ABC transporter ATP-binding protein [uncultured Leifsonia sp.]|uniref:ABC transporter ATP-binding protein n=1 Tax=uncultured Leifsonia sp. TaxID=340359 RepID=UPI0028D29346|nr:ABC transporter ATP-binding protein [uncultured Leifsonia sp.]